MPNYRNVMPMLLRSGGLLESAATALRRTVAADPENAAALLRLGDMCRGTGRLGDALECYERVAALRPDDPKALWLGAVLGGRQLPQPPPDAEPTPFVHRANFLPRQRCSELLALAIASRAQFEPAPFTEEMRQTLTETDSSRGKFVVDPRIVERKVRPWFEARLHGAFAEALPRLRMRRPAKYWVEMAMSACLGGGFFSKHRDNGGRFHTRLLNFIYYFHRQPKRFSGGDLLLYDGDGTGAFTRIGSQHNSIVFFPAACIHQVAAFDSDAADFGDARFAVYGWLRTY